MTDSNRSKNQKPVKSRKVALVHDWLTGMRGGEKVLEELCRMFPHASIFTLVHHKGSVSELIENHPIIESPIIRLPFGRKRFRAWLPLFPWGIESFDLRGYDLVISTSHCVAKGVIPPPDALHIAYVHTPMRYVWDMRSDYLGSDRLNVITRLAAGFMTHYLRNWDVISSSRVDRFVANSNHVKRRIEKYYRRTADVIFPPVDTDMFQIGDSPCEDYYLTVSALVPYKRVDIAVEACSRLGVRLIVVGDGPERNRLERMAGKTVQFKGNMTPGDLLKLYQKCMALIYPGEEDFGITPVEVQAAGRPVVAFGRGGIMDTVRTDSDRCTGAFFHEQSVESLMETIKGFDPFRYDPMFARSNAERFSRGRFISQMTEFIEQAWQQYHLNQADRNNIA